MNPNETQTKKTQNQIQTKTPKQPSPTRNTGNLDLIMPDGIIEYDDYIKLSVYNFVNKKSVIKEFSVENNTPTDYYSSTLNRKIHIEKPSVIAVIEFEIKGIFVKKTIIVSKLSSSQLTSVYD